MGNVYDCFNFFNELDILEIRLNILYEHVDYFVIVESDLTHSGAKKPFYFEENKERYSKFWDKIINYRIYDNPMDFSHLPKTGDKYLNEVYNYINTQTNRFNRQNQPDYGRDFFQKESVRRAISNCNDDDLIILSDVDEIPNPEILMSIDRLDLQHSLYSLNQYTYYYYLNILKQKDWYGSRLGLYKNIKNKSFNEIRGDDSLSNRMCNGGWHFSFMGGPEMVKRKITSYSARDMVNTRILSSVESNIMNDIDPFFRSGLTKVDINNTYPQYIIDNIDKYKHMIK